MTFREKWERFKLDLEYEYFRVSSFVKEHPAEVFTVAVTVATFVGDAIRNGQVKKAEKILKEIKETEKMRLQDLEEEPEPIVKVYRF